MKVFICILVNKIVTLVCRIFGKKGSVLPASIVWDVFKGDKILNKIKFPKYVIAITGSSGKGSTTDLVYKILTKNGYDVCYNSNGSNGVLAAMTLILNNCTLTGRFKHDVLLLECDERHLKLIFGENKMTHLLVTNVTRDQPARNGEPNIVFDDIMKAIGINTKLFINKDDPLVSRLTYLFDLNKHITYGVSKTKDSYTEPPIDSVDYAYCPKCHAKLKYDYYHYGHIGHYSCPKCDFERGKVDYEVEEVDLEHNQIKINGNDIYLNKDVLYAVYYTVAAYAVCKSIGVTDEEIMEAVNGDKLASKRGKVSKLAGRTLTMLETKNENNLSYYQSIRYIKNQKGIKTIILGFDNVSRRYSFNDLSWLWDVEFELLNDESIDKIFVIGRFRYDVLTRLNFSNIPKEKIVLVDDLNNLIKIVRNDSNGDIYTMVCFDMTAIIHKLIEDDENEND
jgi:UDP-N-acetylmuramyl pentapeptide synthase